MNNKTNIRRFTGEWFKEAFWYRSRDTSLLIVAALPTYTADPLVLAIVLLASVVYVILTAITMVVQPGRFQYLSRGDGNRGRHILAGIVLGTLTAGIVWFANWQLGVLATSPADDPLWAKLVALIFGIIVISLANTIEVFFLGQLEKEQVKSTRVVYLPFDKTSSVTILGTITS